MKQVVLNIPDTNYEFFMELMKKLNFTPVEEDDADIPEEVKKMVIDRLNNSKRENLLTWEEAKAKLKY
jgi:hypothetical protein